MCPTADSRSDIAVTIVAFLPPVSASRCMSGRASSIRNAVSVPPVRMTTSASFDATIRAPPVAPEQGTNCSAVRGTPAAQKHWQSRHATSTVCDAGFKMTVFPAASAAATPPHGIATGKFHGGTTTTTPTGRLSTVSSASNARALAA